MTPGCGVERALVEVEQRSPAVAVRRRGGDRQLAPDRGRSSNTTTSEEREASEVAHSRPGGPAPTIATGPREARASCWTTSGAAGRRANPGRRELGIDRAQQHRIEGATVLVARHARPDLALPSGQELRREVRIGDQRPRDPDEVGSRRERSLDLIAAAERLRDQQRPLDERPEPRDAREQRRLLGAHVLDVGRAHADRQVHVVDERGWTCGSSSHSPSSVCPASSPPSAESRMPISSSGADARIAVDDPGHDLRALSRRAGIGPEVGERRRGTARAGSRARRAARSPGIPPARH